MTVAMAVMQAGAGPTDRSTSRAAHGPTRLHGPLSRLGRKPDTVRPGTTTGIVKKVLESAIANAEHNEGADIDELHIAAICVDEGPTMKRIRARAKGRAARILKRTSHIAVTVAEK